MAAKYKIAHYPSATIKTVGDLILALPHPLSGEISAHPFGAIYEGSANQLRIPVEYKTWAAVRDALSAFDPQMLLSPSLLISRPAGKSVGRNGGKERDGIAATASSRAPRAKPKSSAASKRSGRETFLNKVARIARAAVKHKSALVILVLSVSLGASILLDHRSSSPGAETAGKTAKESKGTGFGVNSNAPINAENALPKTQPEFVTSANADTRDTGSHNLSVPAAQPAPRRVAVPAAENYYHLVMGDNNAPIDKQLHVFVDPNCPYCQALEPELMKLASRGWKITQYPVSVLSDDSITKVAGLFCSKTPGDTFVKMMQNSSVALYGTDIKCKEGAMAPAVNTRLLQSLGVDRVPVIIRATDGVLQLGFHSADNIEQWVRSPSGEITPEAAH